MKSISSRTHQEVKALSALSQTKHRHTQQRFIAEGLRTISTIIAGGLEPEKIYITHEWIDTISKNISPEKLVLISKSVLKKISQTTTPSGIVGVFPLQKKNITSLDSGIILDNITNPGNMGTLIRTCAAMGKKTVCCINGVDPYNPKVVQASAGTITHVDIMQGSWSEVLAHRGSLSIYGLTPHAKNSFHSVTNKQALLVIGNEAHGIHPEHLTNCSLYALDMPGNTESLNAAIAGSIAMYLIWSKRSS